MSAVTNTTTGDEIDKGTYDEEFATNDSACEIWCTCP